MGFFNLSTWQAQKQPLQLVPLCGTCQLYKHCSSPKMKPTGKGRKKVLIVAEAPGAMEDRRGIQLVGNTGQELIRILAGIGVDMRQDCYLHNALACRPTDSNGDNRPPEHEEIDFCRPNLTSAIRKYDPDVIIPLGKASVESILPLVWRQESVDEITRWVGWRIPSVKLNSWVCPTYHPAYLLHQKQPAAEMHVARHLREAFRLSGKPWKTRPHWESQVSVEMKHHAAAGAVRGLMARGKPLAIDLETTTLKPDGDKAKILCCSVSDGKISIAFPWFGEAIEAVRELLKSDVPKIAANVRFEARWFRKVFGFWPRNWIWDTVVMAHIADCRGRISSLKFQSFVRFGVEDYSSHLDDYMEGKTKSSNSENRLREVDLRELMVYNGLDSLYEVMVAEDQMRELGVEYGSLRVVQ